MGCDIHFYVERQTAEGPWVTCDKWVPDDYRDGTPGLLCVDYKDQFYHDRNYNLFSILADVRNGRGFAGVKTGSGFNPIAAPRGVPKDCCPEYMELQENYGADGHSHSYFTVAELLAYDWEQTTVLTGVVNPIEWAQWETYGEPESWSGAVGGGNVIRHDESRFQHAWKAVRAQMGWPETYRPGYRLRRDDGNLLKLFNEALGPGSHYTHVQWNRTYAQCAGGFWAKAMPRLSSIAHRECGGDLSKVRITFFFDN